MEESEKVGVFVFDSYFDVMMGLEEKYKRWDLFEAVYRYVRYDQVKRLPSELGKIFKVLKPILDVQKKKLERNEKRRKGKKVEDKANESESLGEVYPEKSGEILLADCEENLRNSKGEDVKNGETFREIGSENSIKKGSKKRVHEEPKVDSEGEPVEELGDENYFRVSESECSQCEENKGLEGDLLIGESEPNGEPNVCHNKNKINNKVKNEKVKTASLDSRLKRGGLDGVMEVQNDGNEEEGNIPTLEEVRDFCEKSCKNVDFEQFYAYYSSKKWKLRGKPIRDWRACLITWDQKISKKYGAREEKVETNEGEFLKGEGKFSHFKAEYDNIDKVKNEI